MMSRWVWRNCLPVRVAITGIGVVSALGCGVESFGMRSRMVARGYGRSPDFDSLRFPNGAQVDGYVASEHFDDKRLTLVDRFAQYALVAAREAVRMSGGKISRRDRYRMQRRRTGRNGCGFVDSIRRILRA